MSLPSELRSAAEKLGHYESPDVETAEIVVALAKLLAREADLQTTKSVLESAGMLGELTLDAAPEARALARAINRSSI